MEVKLSEAAKLERRNYYRAWRAKNKDKLRANSAAYWLRRAERKLKEGETHGK